MLRVKEKSQDKDNSVPKLPASYVDMELLKVFMSFVSSGVKNVLHSTLDVINAYILRAEPGRSIILTLIFQTPLHEKEFMNNLKKLEQCVMEDLKHLPGCQGHDLSHLYVEVEVDEDLYEECLERREESKSKTGSVCFIPVSKPLPRMFITYQLLVLIEPLLYLFFKWHEFAA